MTTYKEHVRWCKQRARDTYAFYAQHEPAKAVHNAMMSLLSDFGKHPETETCAQLTFAALRDVVDKPAFDKFLDGFVE